MDAGRQVSLDSGRDTRLVGSQVSGESITAKVGRDLELRSLQDSDKYDAKQQNISAGASAVIIGTGGGGANFNYSQSKLESDYRSVQEQSGLFAGQGGYQIDVGQHTQLDGAVIGSTAEADKNRLSTGTLGWSDIRNEAKFSSQQQSVSVSSSGSVGDQFLGNMAGGVLSGLSRGDKDSSATRAAVSEGTLEIRDTQNQQQDVANLNRDVEHAHEALSPIFDKEKEQRRLREVQAIAEIGSQVMDVVRTEGQIKANRAGKAELERKGIHEPVAGASDEDREAYRTALVNTKAYKDAMAPYGTGGDYQRVAQAVTAALQGLAGGNINGAIAGAAAPYVAQTIRQTLGDDENARIMAHAVLGAVVAHAQGNSAGAGAAGAVTGELMAGVIIKQLYGDVEPQDLTEEQKQKVSALSTLASGLAGAVVGGDAANAVAGAESGKNAVENNYLSPAQEVQKEKELEECQDRFRCKFGADAKWSLISAQQDVGLIVGVGGGIGLSAAETAEGIYELATNFKEVVGALKLLADSPEFRQQFSDSYFADLEQRAELLTQAYNDAGWDGSVTAGVEGGRFAVELVGLITAVRGAAQVTAKLPSAAKTVVNAIAEAPASGSWKAQAGALGDLGKLEVPGGPKGTVSAPNLTERGTLVNLRPNDVAISQRPVRTLVQDESGRYWLQTSTGKKITPSGSYDFVTMPDGTIRVARPNVNQDFSTHLGLSGGGEVKYAGSIRFGNNDGPSRGAISKWTNNSGHYQPPAGLSSNAGLPQNLFNSR